MAVALIPQELPAWDWGLAMRGGQQLPELPVLTTVRLRACRLDACANRLLWRSPALRVLDCDGPAVNLRAAALFWWASCAVCDGSHSVSMTSQQ